MPVKLLSQILNILQIGKIIVKKYVFENFPTFFLELPETVYMYNNTCWWICVQNFKSGYIEKRLSLTVLNAQKAMFYAISEDLGIFPILNFCPIWTV